MFYATPTQFGLTFDQVRNKFPYLSFRANGFICTDEVYSYLPSSTLDYDPATHAVREVAPVDGVQQWELRELSPEEAQAWRAAQDLQSSAKIDALWQATDAYIARYISGVAIGILALGVAQMKPKALRVSEWTQAIWGGYYNRKSAVTATSIDNHDYSLFGSVPHDVRELKEELGL